MFEIKMFCTECKRNIKLNNVYIDCGIIKKRKCLCICNDCFNNYAVLDINNHPRHRIEHFSEYAKERGVNYV